MAKEDDPLAAQSRASRRLPAVRTRFRREIIVVGAEDARPQGMPTMA